MAKYKIEIIRNGYSGMRKCFDTRECESFVPNKYLTVTAITCEENEDTLTLPDYSSETQMPVTHVGYAESYTPSREEWEDWHHCKGGEIYPAQYTMYESCLNLPSSIKSIYIPKTIIDVSSEAFINLEDVIFSVDPDNPIYTTEDGKLVRKTK